MDDDLDPDDDVVKEMYDGEYNRVDIVSGPASGMRFVVLKAGDTQDPDHVDRIRKAAQSTATQNDLPDSDFAYIESGGKKDESGKTTPRSLRHFPINDAAHVRNALARASQSPFGDKALPKIRAAAKKFGIDTSDGSHSVSKTADPVTKADGETLADGDDLMSDADDGAAGAEVPTEAAGDPDDPTSPAWEAVDAARARQAINMVIALQRLVKTSLARESQEVAVGADPEDGENAYDLCDILDCLDCVLDTLAPFAIGEQAEAEDRESDADEVVTKAGRVLSGTNEGLIRSAQQALTQVLATLPAAIPDTEGSPTMTDVTKAGEAPAEEPAPEAVDVTKAAGDPQLAVYSQTGELIGTVDPSDVTPLANGADSDGDPADTGDAAEGTPTDENAPVAAAASGGEPQPAPAPAPAPAAAAPAVDENGNPVTKTLEGIDTESLKAVLKSAVTEAVTAEREEHARVLKALEDRLATVEAQPALGGPLLGGATGQLFLRGQNTGSEDPEIEQVRKQMEQAADPVVRADLNRQLAILKLTRSFQP